MSLCASFGQESTAPGTDQSGVLLVREPGSKGSTPPKDVHPLRFSSGFLRRESPCCSPGRLRVAGPRRPDSGRTGYSHGSKSKSSPQRTSDSIPTNIGSKMGGEFTYPKMGSQNGFDPQPCNSPASLRRGVATLLRASEAGEEAGESSGSPLTTGVLFVVLVEK